MRPSSSNPEETATKPPDEVPRDCGVAKLASLPHVCTIPEADAMNTTDIPLHRTAEMAVAPDCVPRLTQLAHAELDPPVLYVVYRILLVPSTKSWVRLPWVQFPTC